MKFNMIRKYQETDQDDVLSAWEEASKIAHPFLPKAFQDQVRHDIPTLYLPNADTWVVETENQVVGFIALIGNEVGAIFLQPKHQRGRLGKMMMDKARELHGNLEVEVFEKNIIGLNFYQKYGFQLLEKKIHEPTGEPVLRLKYEANQSP